MAVKANRGQVLKNGVDVQAVKEKVPCYDPGGTAGGGNPGQF